MSVFSNWSVPPAAPRVEHNDVHLWRAFLDCDGPSFERLKASLAEDESIRAARFAFSRDRDRFVACRGILREILAGYLRRPATEVEFIYESEGKPRLRLRDSDPPIRFNVAHSHDLAVFAFACNREVGVDVELVRSDVADDIAERVFSPKELSAWRNLSLAARPEGFFLAWTCKEAYVKARGSGLGIPFDSFEVTAGWGQSEELVSADRDRWMLRTFRPANGYAGALVAEGKEWRLQLWDWPSYR